MSGIELTRNVVERPTEKSKELDRRRRKDPLGIFEEDKKGDQYLVKERECYNCGLKKVCPLFLVGSFCYHEGENGVMKQAHSPMCFCGSRRFSCTECFPDLLWSQMHASIEQVAEVYDFIVPAEVKLLAEAKTFRTSLNFMSTLFKAGIVNTTTSKPSEEVTRVFVLKRSDNVISTLTVPPSDKYKRITGLDLDPGTGVSVISSTNGGQHGGVEGSGGGEGGGEGGGSGTTNVVEISDCEDKVARLGRSDGGDGSGVGTNPKRGTKRTRSVGEKGVDRCKSGWCGTRAPKRNRRRKKAR